MNLLHRLEHLDRRYVFLLIFLALSLPFFFNFSACLDVRVTPPVQSAYDFIEKLPEGSRVLVSFDYGPSTVAEVGPGAVALLKHLQRRKLKLVAVALWPDAPPLAKELLADLGEEAGYKVYEDWTFMGYKYGGPTGSGVIEPMGTNFADVFPFSVGVRGAPSRPASAIPVLQGVTGYKDFALLVSFSAGVPGVKEYIQMANSRYNVPVISAVSRVTAPELYPFLDSGQLAGLVAGVSSGAEYEKLLGYRGLAYGILPVQSVAQITIIALVVIGNLVQILPAEAPAMSISTDISVWVAALLTLAVLSFLYRDNPFYKLAEYLFVGSSAGYYAAQYYWTTLVDDVAKKLAPGAFGLDAEPQWSVLGGVLVGVSILLRLAPPAIGWVSRLGIAFIVGFNAGIQLFSQFSGFILSQISATLQPYYGAAEATGNVLRQIVVGVGTITGLSYFYFSKEQRGWFGWVTRVGIWFLMIGFGAAYGNTVMTRISIMAGRVIFLLGDWLGLIAL